MQDEWVAFWNSPKRNLTDRERWAFSENFRIAYRTYLNHQIGTPVFSGEKTNKKLLEVGCGRGLMSAQFQKNGFEVHGVDNFPAARVHYPGTFHLDDARNLRFEDHSFSLALTYGLLEHFTATDQRVILQEVSRVVKLGGLALHYVVPGKFVNLSEDRSVYRNRCKYLIDNCNPQWVYPVIGDNFYTNKFLGKGFWIHTQNNIGEQHADSCTDYS